MYGKPNSEISKWLDFWNIKSVQSGEYTNFILPDGIELSEIFEDSKHYSYVDSFSPNLNKKLHFGHLANLIIAKYIQSIGLGDNFISVLGDTLEKTTLDKEKALSDFNMYCDKFGYNVSKILLASEQKIIDESILFEGEGDYTGTKIFKIGDQKIVAIKNAGQTSYFYQDVAVAQNLNSTTLYVTGFEQNEHFINLKILFPHIDHIGMGLVMLDGEKMSSSKGNVIFIEEYIKKLKEIFDDDKLIYNIICGSILSSSINSIKKIKTEDILNVKMSPGLYISYTQAKMWSAGIEYQEINKFSDKELEFKYLKSKYNIQPNILLSGIIQKCEEINKLYEIHWIKDNIGNKKMYQILVNDLMLACKYIGMFKINKV